LCHIRLEELCVSFGVFEEIPQSFCLMALKKFEHKQNRNIILNEEIERKFLSCFIGNSTQLKSLRLTNTYNQQQLATLASLKLPNVENIRLYIMDNSNAIFETVMKLFPKLTALQLYTDEKFYRESSFQSSLIIDTQLKEKELYPYIKQFSNLEHVRLPYDSIEPIQLNRLLERNGGTLKMVEIGVTDKTPINVNALPVLKNVESLVLRFKGFKDSTNFEYIPNKFPNIRGLLIKEVTDGQILDKILSNELCSKLIEFGIICHALPIITEAYRSCIDKIHIQCKNLQFIKYNAKAFHKMDDCFHKLRQMNPNISIVEEIGSTE